MSAAIAVKQLPIDPEPEVPRLCGHCRFWLKPPFPKTFGYCGYTHSIRLTEMRINPAATMGCPAWERKT